VKIVDKFNGRPEREIRIKRQICSIQRHSMHGVDWIKRPILKEQRIIQWLALNF
jgi:hypothetical protein